MEKLTLDQLKEQVRNYISRAKTQEAIEVIKQWANEANDENMKNILSNIEGDLAAFKHDKLLGLIPSSESAVRSAQINNRILSLSISIDELKKEINTKTEKKTVKIDRFVALPAKENAKPKYKEAQLQNIEHIIRPGVVLLATATKTETNALHSSMTPLPSYENLLKFKVKNQFYYLGLFGKYAVVHVECGDMGSVTSAGSTITITNAIDSIQPKFVLMVGIAFGVDDEKQNIGDVLVSKTLIPYEIQRIGADKIIQRGPKPEANNSLRNTFNSLRDWEYTLPNNEEASYEVCDILSGEKLVDKEDFRNQLIESFPTAKGGEMEGAGLYAACQNKDIDWILIKSICDYADGEKREGKKEKQALAIETALNFCLHAFNQKYIFEDLGVFAFDEKSSTD